MLSLLPVVIALLFVTKSATTAAEEGKRKGPLKSKLRSDVVDARATKAQRMTDEDRLTKTPKELMRDAHKARQSRTNEKRKKTLGRRVLVFQRDVVDVSDENGISGAFEKRKEELFAARTTKASDGGQRVPQTISKEDGRKIEEETGSRERLFATWKKKNIRRCGDSKCKVERVGVLRKNRRSTRRVFLGNGRGANEATEELVGE